MMTTMHAESDNNEEVVGDGVDVRWGKVLDLRSGWWLELWPPPGEKLTIRFSSAASSSFKTNVIYVHILAATPPGAIPAQPCNGQVRLWQGRRGEQVFGDIDVDDDHNDEYWTGRKTFMTAIVLWIQERQPRPARFLQNNPWHQHSRHYHHHHQCPLSPSSFAVNGRILYIIWMIMNDTTQVLVRRELEGYRAVGALYSFSVEEQVLSFMILITDEPRPIFSS